MTEERHPIGSIVLATFSNGMQRRVRIFAYDSDGMVWVGYPDYDLPREWIKRSYLP